LIVIIGTAYFLQRDPTSSIPYLIGYYILVFNLHWCIMGELNVIRSNDGVARSNSLQYFYFFSIVQPRGNIMPLGEAVIDRKNHRSFSTTQYQSGFRHRDRFLFGYFYYCRYMHSWE